MAKKAKFPVSELIRIALCFAADSMGDLAQGYEQAFSLEPRDEDRRLAEHYREIERQMRQYRIKRFGMTQMEIDLEAAVGVSAEQVAKGPDNTEFYKP